jgi:hypothetical protein
MSFSIDFTLKKTAVHSKAEIFSDKLQPGVFDSAQLFLTDCVPYTYNSSEKIIHICINWVITK